MRLGGPIFDSYETPDDWVKAVKKAGYRVACFGAAAGGIAAYSAFLFEVGKLAQDVPAMLEHLREAEEYADAAAYVRGVAETKGLVL